MRARLIVLASALLLMVGCTNSGESDRLRTQVSDLQSQVASLEGQQGVALKQARATEDAMRTCATDLRLAAWGLTFTIESLASDSALIESPGIDLRSCKGVLKDGVLRGLKERVVAARKDTEHVMEVRLNNLLGGPGPSSPSDRSGPTAVCNDGTYSYSEHASGTCSWHGGVRTWVNYPG